MARAYRGIVAIDEQYFQYNVARLGSSATAAVEGREPFLDQWSSAIPTTLGLASMRTLNISIIHADEANRTPLVCRVGLSKPYIILSLPASPSHLLRTPHYPNRNAAQNVEHGRVRRQRHAISQAGPQWLARSRVVPRRMCVNAFNAYRHDRRIDLHALQGSPLAKPSRAIL